MGREDRIEMSQKDLKRLHVIEELLEERLTQIEASEVLDLTDRQIRRIVKRVQEEGPRGILHRLRQKPSNHRISGKIKKKVLELYQAKYPDFGPTLASEKLEELNGIKLSDETLRLWLLEEAIPYEGRKKRKHRQWRERKPSLGEMIQMDGSHHDWLEGRGPWLVLMAYKDDATGKVFARFYEYEGTLPALDSLKRYVGKYGIPQSLYLDKHITYQATTPIGIEEELEGKRKLLSQFRRACEELGIQVIHAHSPQAKGRVERQFRTFQHCLIREMRLEGIKTLKDANVLLERYLPKYNRRFEVPAANKANLHRPVSQDLKLKSIFSTKEKRVLRNDFTVAYKTKFYQIPDKIQAPSVTVEERLDGSLHFMHEGREVPVKEIPFQPKPLVRPKPLFRTITRKYLPIPKTHPWKAFPTLPQKEALVTQ